MICKSIIDRQMKLRYYLETTVGLSITFMFIHLLDKLSGVPNATRLTYKWAIILLIQLGVANFSWSRAKSNPNLLMTEGSDLIYAPKGKKALLIPLNSIEKVIFKWRGIGLVLKKERAQGIKILQPNFKLSRLWRQGRLQKCDLFFMNFPESAKTALENALISQNSHPNCVEPLE